MFSIPLFRVYKIWETPRPESSMRPTFPKASEDLKQTSILQGKKRFETCYTLYASYSLILTPRAVEFFIRDKYEKKKYYSEKVTNGSSVCTNSFLMILCNFYAINCFFPPFVAFRQPKDAKKERDTDRGSRASSYSKVSKSHEFLLSQILFLHALFFKK